MGIPMWDNNPIVWSRRRATRVPPIDSDEGSEGSIDEPGEGKAAEEEDPSDRDDVDRQSGGSEGAQRSAEFPIGFGNGSFIRRKSREASWTTRPTDISSTLGEERMAEFDLADFVEQVAKELHEAHERTKDKTNDKLVVFDSCEMEVGLTVTKGGEGGISIKIVEVGGKYLRSRVNKVKLKFTNLESGPEWKLLLPESEPAIPTNTPSGRD